MSPSWTKENIKNKIADTAIQKILLNYLEAKNNKPEEAFSPLGIEELNRNIELYNNGHKHKPILKVSKYESGNKFPIGKNGVKSKQFVENDANTNLFFMVYEYKNERQFVTVPLNVVIASQMDALSKGIHVTQWDIHLDTYLREISLKEQNLEYIVNEDWKFLFCLSPNSLVYLPSEEDVVRGEVLKVNSDRVYKMVSCSKKQCFFLLASVSDFILKGEEFSSSNKMEKAITGEMIKNTCIPLEIDKLGNIKLKK